MTTPFDEDPWAADEAPDALGEEEEFDSARDGFPRVEWVIDRLVLAWPLEVVVCQGDNGPYDAMECRLVVLDGETNDNIPKIPFEILPFRFSGASIVKDLKYLLGGTKPKLARVHSGPSKRKGIPARWLTSPSTEDKALARAYLRSSK